MNKMAKKDEGQRSLKDVVIPGMRWKNIVVPIENVEGSSLLMNRFPDEVRQDLEDKNQGRPVKKRTPLSSEEIYERCFHVIDGKKKIYGFPSDGFKGACIGAARFIPSITMEQIKGMMHIIPDNGDLVRINGTPNMRKKDVARNQNAGGAPAPLTRAEFKNWFANLKMRFNEEMITEEQAIQLLNIAGSTQGIGPWRPSLKGGGSHGMFQVKANRKNIKA